MQPYTKLLAQGRSTKSATDQHPRMKSKSSQKMFPLQDQTTRLQHPFAQRSASRKPADPVAMDSLHSLLRSSEPRSAEPLSNPRRQIGQFRQPRPMPHADRPLANANRSETPASTTSRLAWGRPSGENGLLISRAHQDSASETGYYIFCILPACVCRPSWLPCSPLLKRFAASTAHGIRQQHFLTDG